MDPGKTEDVFPCSATKELEGPDSVSRHAKGLDT